MLKNILPYLILVILSFMGFALETSAQAPSFAPVTVQAEFRMEIRYLHRQGPHGALRPLTSGSILRSGDLYGIEFTPLQDGFVYIFQVESNGRITQLFPANDLNAMSLGHQNPVSTQQHYRLPAPEQFFQVNSASIPRDVYILGSLQQDLVQESYYRNMLLERARQNSFRESIFQTELLRHLQQLKLSRLSPFVESEWVEQHSLHPPGLEQEVETFFDFHMSFDTSGNFSLRELKGPEDVSGSDSFAGLPKVTLFHLFAEGNGRPAPESLPLLHEYGKALEKTLHDAVFVIAAHSEKQGGAIEDWELSRQRAESVKDFFLTQYHINADRLIIRPYGSARPIASDESTEGRRLNNRIEFIRVK